jgi:hypothetical protein
VKNSTSAQIFKHVARLSPTFFVFGAAFFAISFVAIAFFQFSYAVIDPICCPMAASRK